MMTTAMVDISRFSTSLFSLLSSSSSPSSNVIISPLGIAQSLSLLVGGATPKSKCETELLETLGVGTHQDIPRLTETLLGEGVGGDTGVELTTANSLWSRGTIKSSYKTLAQTVHSADSLELPPTYDPMNEWIAKYTKGLIPTLFPPQQEIDELTVAVLVNAVHFKGMWSSKFDAKDTVDGTFHSFAAEGGTTSKEQPARFMKASRKMKAASEVRSLNGASVVKLDYGTDSNKDVSHTAVGRRQSARDYCALFILPPDSTPQSMEETVQLLTNNPLSNILGHLYERDVDLTLPRFRASYGTKSIKPQLYSMGIHDAFDGTDVFTNISDDPDVHVDDVFHKAIIEVTEEGTVAAAATGVVIATRSLPPPPLELTFDRPFIMLVLHAPTGTPLFMSKLVEPELDFESQQ